MSRAETGGSAFPVIVQTEVATVTEPGMSLRDYFAGQALAGILAFPGRNVGNQTVCEQCYQVADCMIAERNKAK